MRKVLLRMFIGLGISLILLIAVGWIGTKVDIQAFDMPDGTSQDLGYIDPPSDLPAPVARFVDVAFGDQIPVVETAILVGTADLRINGLTLPVREKLYYQAGEAYYHYFEVGWFGQPVLTINERFQDGITTLDLPGNFIEDEPNTNAAGNLGLWAESIWFPSIYFTDDRMEWQAVDENTVRLIVPNAADEEIFTITFDPDSGLIDTISTLRYQNPDDTQRTLWTNTIVKWERMNGVMIPIEAETQWADNKPWAIWHVDEIVYNVDVSKRFAQFGGDFND